MPINELEILSDLRRFLEEGVDAEVYFIEDDDDGILVISFKGKVFAISVIEIPYDDYQKRTSQAGK